MSNKPTGGPACPCVLTNATNKEVVGFDGEMVSANSRAEYSGRTMRDYFAVHASDEDIKAQAPLILDRQIAEGGGSILRDGWHIKARYMHADQMLEARKS
jgi:hypothetical protein